MRSIAQLMIVDKIRVNAICTGAVLTPILPSEVRSALPHKVLTPVSIVVSVVLSLVDGNEMTDADGYQIPGNKLHGQTVEASVDKFYFRPQPGYCDGNMERVWAVL